MKGSDVIRKEKKRNQRMRMTREREGEKWMEGKKQNEMKRGERKGKEIKWWEGRKGQSN